MRSVYPETLPACLCELPDLLKGKVAEAAEIFLSARCDYEGALACEAAARLLDEEMISQDTAYSFQERWNILANAHQLDDRSLEDGAGMANDPVIRDKIGFVIFLATSYAQRERDNYFRSMDMTAHCARHLAEIYRGRLEEEDEALEAREAEHAA